MKKRTPEQRAWFEQKIAELGNALNQLPPERQKVFEAEVLTEDAPARLLLAPDALTRIGTEPAAVVRQLRRGVLDSGRAHLFIRNADEIRMQRSIPDGDRREEIRSVLLVVATEETDPARMAHDQMLVLVTDDEELTARAWLLGVTVWHYARFRAHVCELRSR